MAKLEEEAAGAMGALMIVAIIIAAWFTIKATELVIRVLVLHPQNRPMWIALGNAVVWTVIAWLTQGQSSVVNGVTVLSIAALLIVAKAVEVYYEPRFLEPLTRESVVHGVLHEPWWQAA